MENPIKYSDLISPDDSITTLISQLEQLNEAYTGMATSVRQQAASVAASLKNVSGATAQGQQATRNAAAEADKLDKAYRQLDFALSDNARKLAEVKAITKEQNTLTKLQVIANNAAEGSYNKLSAQYSILKIRLNEMSEAERKNTKEGQDMEKQAKKIYDEMNRLQQATGKYALNVGNYSNAITQAIGINTRWYKGLQEIAVLTEGGLSQGIKTAGSAVGAFGRSLLALLANPIVATIAGITAAFMALAKGISTSEQNTNTLMRILAPFRRILTEVLDVIQGIATKILMVVEGFENLAMGASRLMERLPLVGSAFKKVNDALQENIDLERERQSLKQQSRANTEENAKLERDVALLKNIAASTKDVQMKEMALRNARRKEEEILKNNIEYAKRIVALKEKEVAQNQSDTQALDELAEARANVSRAETAFLNHTLRINKQLANLRKDGSGSGGSGKNTRAKKDPEIDNAKQVLEEQRKIEDAKIALVEDTFVRERMTIITSYNRKIEDLKGSEEYVTQMKLLYEQQREQELAKLFEKEADEQKRREEKDLQDRLKATDKLVAEYKKRQEEENKKEHKDIYDLLGFKFNDDQKNALDDAFAYAMDHLSQYLAAWEQVAARKAQLAEEEVSRTKRLLDSEIEARNNGYAANVALAQKEYENAKKNQDKALQEQRRAQRAQEAMQTISQASNLVTASTLIWSQLGFPWALPAIAVMWGSFAAAKIKAMELTSGSEEYGEGTVELLQGGSHQSGNDIDLGRKKDGTRRRAEGGEYFAVINKRNSRRYRDVIPGVINALNDGTFAQKYQRAYDDGGVSVSVQAQSPDVNVQTQSPDIRELSNDVRLIRQQGEQGSTFDANGNEIVRYKNLRRIIRNK